MYFMSLYTGKRINSYIREELPISDEITERVGEMALRQNQPQAVNGIPLFEWNSMNTDQDELENNEEDEVAQENDTDDEIENQEQEENNNQVTVANEEEEINDDEESLQVDQVREYDEADQESDSGDNEEIEFQSMKTKKLKFLLMIIT